MNHAWLCFPILLYDLNLSATYDLSDSSRRCGICMQYFITICLSCSHNWTVYINLIAKYYGFNSTQFTARCLPIICIILVMQFFITPSTSYIQDQVLCKDIILRVGINEVISYLLYKVTSSSNSNEYLILREQNWTLIFLMWSHVLFKIFCYL